MRIGIAIFSLWIFSAILQCQKFKLFNIVAVFHGYSTTLWLCGWMVWYHILLLENQFHAICSSVYMFYATFRPSAPWDICWCCEIGYLMRSQAAVHENLMVKNEAKMYVTLHFQFIESFSHSIVLNLFMCLCACQYGNPCTEVSFYCGSPCYCLVINWIVRYYW